MPAEADARHGTAQPRGLEPTRGRAIGGRFGRMFGDCAPCEAGREALDDLVAAMELRTELQQSRSIPAGFTYLAQFVDHDITFDATPLLDRETDPHALVNFRTPRLDLDSVYGAGPVVQPYLYDWDAEPAGTKMLLGDRDLPRNDPGRALIGDARNDENAIIAQLHLLFLRFHNAVADHLAGPDLAAIQQVVRRHYQWIVVDELLPKLVGRDAVDRALREHAHDQPGERPFIPVEFSAAAYRFGHSMVRNEYGLRRHPPGKDSEPPSSIFPALQGFRPLTAARRLDWERFFKLPGHGLEAQASAGIDTAIAAPLYQLPEGEPRLPRRNLLRGHALELPSGQGVACALGVPALPPEALRIDDTVAERSREVLLRSTPLWYYVLAEAERDPDQRLGPVGGAIVADVLAGLLHADPGAFVREPDWRPRELGTDGRFGMADLIAIARSGVSGVQGAQPRAAPEA